MNFKYIFELRDEVEYATYAVTKRKTEKNSISGFLFAAT